MPNWVGASVRRSEDEPLVRGAGSFLADIRFPRQLYARFVRSPLAHAEIRSIDSSEATRIPGVVGVFTYHDFPAGPLPPFLWDNTPEGLVEAVRPFVQSCHPPLLASDRATYVGQAVAVVLAESRYLAEDATEQIDVDYHPLPVVANVEAALRPGAAVVHQGWDDNVAVRVEVGMGDADAAFLAAHTVIRDTFVIQRQAGVPLEPRGAAAEYDERAERLTLWSSTQNVHPLKRAFERVSGLSSESVRVIAPDVGGGFGTKGVLYPEDLIVGLLAVSVLRPVKWVEERVEHMQSAIHARDQVHEIELALSADGRILALRDEVTVNCGAYNPLGLVIPYNTLAHLVGPYRIDNMSAVAKGVITNSVPTAPYRGAGRPEAVFALERAIERSGRELGIDSLEIRRRNLIQPDEMPYAAGILYRDGHPLVLDSGDYPATLEKAASMLQGDAPRTARTNARRRGFEVGIGYACYVEGTGIGPFEGAAVSVGADGAVVVRTGASSQGQGHATVLAQICADELGVPLASISVVGGDTDQIERGWGTVASRSAVVAGNAVAEASGVVRTKCLKVGAIELGADVGGVELVGAIVSMKDDPERSIGLASLAVISDKAGDPLEATFYYEPPTVTWSHGAHAVSVAVDKETGEVSILDYAVVHDCGTVINPAIVDGQVQGAVAQGIGAALYEEIVYDEDAQLLNATLADYVIPTVMEAPEILLAHLVSPSPLNRLGIKGVGEGGTVAPPAAIANAVENALADDQIVIRRTPLRPSYIKSLLGLEG